MNWSRQAKAKGRITENMVVEYLNANGFRTERRRLSGIEDAGDVSGLHGWVIEVKGEKRINLPGWLAELAVEVQNADKKFPDEAPHEGVVIARKKGKPFVGEWYAVLPVDRFVEIIKALEK